MVTKDLEKATMSNSQNSESEKSEGKGLPKDVYVIAQEIKIVKSLASHDPIQRSKQLRKLQKWLQIRSNSSFAFSEDDFLRLWKGLYFCMWMCDKPLNQENLAEDFGQLLKCFNNVETSIQFFGAFLKTMCLEWFGIDQWRMDKFMMLIRRMFRAIFQVIKENDWSLENIDLFNSQLLSTGLTEEAPVGLAMHIMDVYLEELGKIANGQISSESVTKFLKPFIVYLATQKELKLLGYARNRIFYHLLWQSDLGREHMEKFNAWKEMGFPTGSISALEKVEEEAERSEDEGDEISESPTKKALDPRAGNVDVFIPALPVDPKGIICNLEEIQYTEVTNTKSRRFIKTILEKYKILESGEFPLGVKKIPKLEMEPFKTLVNKKVTELENLEDTIYSTTRKLKKLNKKKRKKLLSSLNFEELTEETFEEAIKNAIEGSRKRKHLSSISDEWLEEEIPQSSQTSVEQKNINDATEKKSEKKKNKNQRKKLKLSGKVEKENSSNAANHNESSNGNSDWNESENITPQKSVNLNETVQNKSNETLSEENEQKTNDEPQQQKSDWDKPLKEGEVEYFVPSRKLKLKQIKNESKLNCDEIENSDNLVINPFAKKTKQANKSVLLGKNMKKAKSTLFLNENKMQKATAMVKTTTPSSQKKVKIVLQKNTIQKPSDYIQQVKSSPKVPYDAEKMPSKSLLKPNLTPSPINPFYKKKIGLKFSESF